MPEELVHSMAEIERKHLDAYGLSAEEKTAVRRGLQEMREGKLANDVEVATVFARNRA